MSRVSCCPLGYNGLLCELPHDKPCGNYRFCRLQSVAWEIPYEYIDGQLVVKFYARMYVFLKSKIYRDIGTYEMSNLIVNAWQEVGWASAEPWLFDPIPF
jgi:hypothetical protein